MGLVPALFSKMSILLKAAMAVSASLFTSSILPRWASTTSARRPSAAISAATFSRSSTLRLAEHDVCPCLSESQGRRTPYTRLAPVTMVTFFSGQTGLYPA